MPQESTTIEVGGSNANDAAKVLLSALGIRPGDIAYGNLRFDLANGGATTVVLEANGPHAGDIIEQMVGPVEWDEFNVENIKATVAEREDESKEGDEDGDEDGDDSRQGNAFRPQVSPTVGSVDPTYVEFPGGEPGRLTENTQLHAIARLLVDCRETMGRDWIPAKTLSGFAGDEFTLTQIRGGLSRLFTNKGLTVRRQMKDADQREYEHNPTKELCEEVERLGDYDIAEVRSSERSNDPTSSST